MFTLQSKPASGFQIAFLVLAIAFGTAISSQPIARAIGWPMEHWAKLGQVLTTMVAATILFGIPSLRRFCMAQLLVPLPHSSYAELALVVPAKLTIPFAVSGVLVLWGLTVDPGFDYYRALFLHENVADLVSTKAPLPIGGALLIVAMSCFVGPVVEELLFRGLLYRAWERQWGWIPATFLTSAVFAFYHPTHLTSTFIGSLVFICLFRRTGSLRAPIIVHCLFNMLVSTSYYQDLLLVKSKADAAMLTNWTFQLTCLAFVLVALPTYIWAARRPRQTASMGTHVST
jgi:uncharacterized protein